jgi:hypothetical protein
MPTTAMRWVLQRYVAVMIDCCWSACLHIGTSQIHNSSCVVVFEPARVLLLLRVVLQWIQYIGMIEA